VWLLIANYQLTRSTLHTHTQARTEGPQVLYPHNFSHPRTDFSMWTTLPHNQECLLWISNSFTGRDMPPAILRSRITKNSRETPGIIPTYNSGQQPATHSRALYYRLVRPQQEIVDNDYCTKHPVHIIETCRDGKQIV